MPTDSALAYALLRLVIGVNFATHGISRLLAGPANFADGVVTEFAPTFLPAWSVHAFGLAIPPVELILGLLLVVGLFTLWTLVASLLLIAALTFGSCLIQDWAVAGGQLPYAAILAALLFLRVHNQLSVDSAIDRP